MIAIILISYSGQLFKKKKVHSEEKKKSSNTMVTRSSIFLGAIQYSSPDGWEFLYATKKSRHKSFAIYLLGTGIFSSSNIFFLHIYKKKNCHRHSNIFYLKPRIRYGDI